MPIERVLADDALALTPIVTLTLHDLRWLATVPGWTPPAMRRGTFRSEGTDAGS